MKSDGKLGLLCATAVATVFGAVYLYFFQAALTQDENHIQNHLAILRLEMSRKDAVEISGDPAHLMTKSFGSAIAYLESKGWQQTNRFGATLTFEKRNPQEHLSASCGLYSRLYMTCDVSEPYQR